MTIVNLTQHPASEIQLEAGVVEPANKQAVKDLLTFEKAPDIGEIERRATALAQIAAEAQADAAMIGGAPYLMGPLEAQLEILGVRPLYSFSRRESLEQTQSDGSVRKVNIFVHTGWVDVGIL